MKFLLTEEACDIPEKVSVKVRARVVEVNNSLYFFPLILTINFKISIYSYLLGYRPSRNYKKSIQTCTTRYICC